MDTVSRLGLGKMNKHARLDRWVGTAREDWLGRDVIRGHCMLPVGDVPFWVAPEGEEPVAKEVEDCEVERAATGSHEAGK